jgi:hypothetical protein
MGHTRDLAGIPVSFSKMATMPTPSMSLSLGRVHRSADSHVRVTPLASLYVFLSAVRIDPPCRPSRGSLVGPDLLDQFCPHRLALELYIKGWFFIVQDVMGEAGLASRSHLRGAQCRGPWLRLQTWLRVYCSRGYNNLDGVSRLCSNILKIAKGMPGARTLSGHRRLGKTRWTAWFP